MLTDGTFVFAFSGIKESDPFGFVFRVYEDAKLQKVIDNLSILLIVFFFKETLSNYCPFYISFVSLLQKNMDQK